MAITDKYELDTTNYGTTGWNALNATAFETLDDKVHTYLRKTVASGESIAAYDPVQIYQGQWRKAQADGTRSPAHGIAIESGSSGEYTRAQRIGPLVNTGWSWALSGEIYLGATGTLVQVAPAANVQIMGYPIDATTILIHPQQSLVAGGTYVEAGDIVTEIGTPGSDTKVTSEQAVREEFAKYPVSGEFLCKDDIITTVGTPGSDVRVPSEQAVREALAGMISGEYVLVSNIATTVGTPGEDTKVPSEQAVREEFAKYPVSGEFLCKGDIILSVGTPGSDTRVPSEQGVREEFSKYPVSGEFLCKGDIITTIGTPGSDTRVPSEQAVREAFAGLPVSGEWVSKGEIGGGGDVYGPTPTTENYVPQWDAAAKTLKNGLAVGTGANNLVQLDGSSKLPAVDGSQLTGITSGAAAAVVYTKTDDYTILSGELGNIFRMNAAVEKSFTMPAGADALDGKRATIGHINDNGLLNILAQGTNKMGFSSTVPGAMYHNASGEVGANVTLEWNKELGRWMPISAFGTWGIV